MRATTVAALLLISLTAAYALARATALIIGPTLTVIFPESHAAVPQYFTLEGQVQHAAFLSINDRRVYPDAEGRFSADLVLPAGYAIVEVYARNRQRRETVIHLPLYIQP